MSDIPTGANGFILGVYTAIERFAIRRQTLDRVPTAFVQRANTSSIPFDFEHLSAAFGASKPDIVPYRRCDRNELRWKLKAQRTRQVSSGTGERRVPFLGGILENPFTPA